MPPPQMTMAGSASMRSPNQRMPTPRVEVSREKTGLGATADS
jgi:hypothetical protein